MVRLVRLMRLMSLVRLVRSVRMLRVLRATCRVNYSPRVEGEGAATSWANVRQSWDESEVKPVLDWHRALWHGAPLCKPRAHSPVSAKRTQSCSSGQPAPPQSSKRKAVALLHILPRPASPTVPSGGKQSVNQWYNPISEEGRPKWLVQ